MKAKMRPETIKRRAKERVEARELRKAELRRRLLEKARQEGPESIWAEMLAEHDAR